MDDVEICVYAFDSSGQEHVLNLRINPRLTVDKAKPVVFDKLRDVTSDSLDAQDYTFFDASNKPVQVGWSKLLSACEEGEGGIQEIWMRHSSQQVVAVSGMPQTSGMAGGAVNVARQAFMSLSAQGQKELASAKPVQTGAASKVLDRVKSINSSAWNKIRDLYANKDLQMFGEAQSALRKQLKSAADHLMAEADQLMELKSYSDAAVLYRKSVQVYKDACSSDQAREAVRKAEEAERLAASGKQTSVFKREAKGKLAQAKMSALNGKSAIALQLYQEAAELFSSVGDSEGMSAAVCGISKSKRNAELESVAELIESGTAQLISAASSMQPEWEQSDPDGHEDIVVESLSISESEPTIERAKAEIAAAAEVVLSDLWPTTSMQCQDPRIKIASVLEHVDPQTALMDVEYDCGAGFDTRVAHIIRHRGASSSGQHAQHYILEISLPHFGESSRTLEHGNSTNDDSSEETVPMKVKFGGVVITSKSDSACNVAVLRQEDLNSPAEGLSRMLQGLSDGGPVFSTCKWLRSIHADAAAEAEARQLETEAGKLLEEHRFEQAAELYRQSANIYQELGDESAAAVCDECLEHAEAKVAEIAESKKEVDELLKEAEELRLDGNFDKASEMLSKASEVAYTTFDDDLGRQVNKELKTTEAQGEAARQADSQLESRLKGLALEAHRLIQEGHVSRAKSMIEQMQRLMEQSGKTKTANMDFEQEISFVQQALVAEEQQQEEQSKSKEAAKECEAQASKFDDAGNLQEAVSNLRCAVEKYEIAGDTAAVERCKLQLEAKQLEQSSEATRMSTQTRCQLLKALAVEDSSLWQEDSHHLAQFADIPKLNPKLCIVHSGKREVDIEGESVEVHRARCIVAGVGCEQLASTLWASNERGDWDPLVKEISGGGVAGWQLATDHSSTEPVPCKLFLKQSSSEEEEQEPLDVLRHHVCLSNDGSSHSSSTRMIVEFSQSSSSDHKWVPLIGAMLEDCETPKFVEHTNPGATEETSQATEHNDTQSSSQARDSEIPATSFVFFSSIGKPSSNIPGMDLLGSALSAFSSENNAQQIAEHFCKKGITNLCMDEADKSKQEAEQCMNEGEFSRAAKLFTAGACLLAAAGLADAAAESRRQAQRAEDSDAMQASQNAAKSLLGDLTAKAEQAERDCETDDSSLKLGACADAWNKVASVAIEAKDSSTATCAETKSSEFGRKAAAAEQAEVRQQRYSEAQQLESLAGELAGDGRSAAAADKYQLAAGAWEAAGESEKAVLASNRAKSIQDAAKKQEQIQKVKGQVAKIQSRADSMIACGREDAAAKLLEGAAKVLEETGLSSEANAMSSQAADLRAESLAAKEKELAAQASVDTACAHIAEKAADKAAEAMLPANELREELKNVALVSEIDNVNLRIKELQADVENAKQAALASAAKILQAAKTALLNEKFDSAARVAQQALSAYEEIDQCEAGAQGKEECQTILQKANAELAILGKKSESIEKAHAMMTQGKALASQEEYLPAAVAYENAASCFEEGDSHEQASGAQQEANNCRTKYETSKVKSACMLAVTAVAAASLLPVTERACSLPDDSETKGITFGVLEEPGQLPKLYSCTVDCPCKPHALASLLLQPSSRQSWCDENFLCHPIGSFGSGIQNLQLRNTQNDEIQDIAQIMHEDTTTGAVCLELNMHRLQPCLQEDSETQPHGALSNALIFKPSLSTSGQTSIQIMNPCEHDCDKSAFKIYHHFLSIHESGEAGKAFMAAMALKGEGNHEAAAKEFSKAGELYTKAGQTSKAKEARELAAECEKEISKEKEKMDARNAVMTALGAAAAAAAIGELSEAEAKVSSCVPMLAIADSEDLARRVEEAKENIDQQLLATSIDNHISSANQKCDEEKFESALEELEDAQGLCSQLQDGGQSKVAEINKQKSVISDQMAARNIRLHACDEAQRLESLVEVDERNGDLEAALDLATEALEFANTSKNPELIANMQARADILHKKVHGQAAARKEAGDLISEAMSDLESEQLECGQDKICKAEPLLEIADDIGLNARHRRTKDALDSAMQARDDRIASCIATGDKSFQQGLQSERDEQMKEAASFFQSAAENFEEAGVHDKAEQSRGKAQECLESSKKQDAAAAAALAAESSRLRATELSAEGKHAQAAVAWEEAERHALGAGDEQGAAKSAANANDARVNARADAIKTTCALGISAVMEHVQGELPSGLQEEQLNPVESVASPTHHSRRMTVASDDQHAASNKQHAVHPNIPICHKAQGLSGDSFLSRSHGEVLGHREQICKDIWDLPSRNRLDPRTAVCNLVESIDDDTCVARFSMRDGTEKLVLRHRACISSGGGANDTANGTVVIAEIPVKEDLQPFSSTSPAQDETSSESPSSQVSASERKESDKIVATGIAVCMPSSPTTKRDNESSSDASGRAARGDLPSSVNSSDTPVTQKRGENNPREAVEDSTLSSLGNRSSANSHDDSFEAFGIATAGDQESLGSLAATEGIVMAVQMKAWTEATSASHAASIQSSQERQASKDLIGASAAMLAASAASEALGHFVEAAKEQSEGKRLAAQADLLHHNDAAKSEVQRLLADAGSLPRESKGDFDAILPLLKQAHSIAQSNQLPSETIQCAKMIAQAETERVAFDDADAKQGEICEAKSLEEEGDTLVSKDEFSQAAILFENAARLFGKNDLNEDQERATCKAINARENAEKLLAEKDIRTNAEKQEKLADGLIAARLFPQAKQMLEASADLFDQIKDEESKNRCCAKADDCERQGKEEAEREARIASARDSLEAGYVCLTDGQYAKALPLFKEAAAIYGAEHMEDEANSALAAASRCTDRLKGEEDRRLLVEAGKRLLCEGEQLLTDNDLHGAKAAFEKAAIEFESASDIPMARAAQARADDVTALIKESSKKSKNAVLAAEIEAQANSDSAEGRLAAALSGYTQATELFKAASDAEGAGRCAAARSETARKALLADLSSLCESKVQLAVCIANEAADETDEEGIQCCIAGKESGLEDTQRAVAVCEVEAESLASKAWDLSARNNWETRIGPTSIIEKMSAETELAEVRVDPGGGMDPRSFVMCRHRAFVENFGCHVMVEFSAENIDQMSFKAPSTAEGQAVDNLQEDDSQILASCNLWALVVYPGTSPASCIATVMRNEDLNLPGKGSILGSIFSVARSMFSESAATKAAIGLRQSFSGKASLDLVGDAEKLMALGDYQEAADRFASAEKRARAAGDDEMAVRCGAGRAEALRELERIRGGDIPDQTKLLSYIERANLLRQEVSMETLQAESMWLNYFENAFDRASEIEKDEQRLDRDASLK